MPATRLRRPELAPRHGVRGRERRLSARLRDRRQQQPVFPDRGVSAPPSRATTTFHGQHAGNGVERWATSPASCCRSLQARQQALQPPLLHRRLAGGRVSASPLGGVGITGTATSERLAHHPGRRPEFGRHRLFPLSVYPPSDDGYTVPPHVLRLLVQRLVPPQASIASCDVGTVPRYSSSPAVPIQPEMPLEYVRRASSSTVTLAVTEISHRKCRGSVDRIVEAGSHQRSTSRPRRDGLHRRLRTLRHAAGNTYGEYSYPV